LLKTVPEKTPSVIVLLVEGFGSDFLEGGKYEGYAPFLDSLSKAAALWPNTLATPDVHLEFYLL
jgi:hypothetical protein